MKRQENKKYRVKDTNIISRDYTIVAECSSRDMAGRICRLLNNEEEKMAKYLESSND